MPFWSALNPQMLLGGAAGFLGGSILAPIQRTANHQMNEIYPNEVLDVGSIIRLMWTHPHEVRNLELQLQQQGYGGDKTDQLLRASIRWPTPDEILQLILLGKIDKDKPFEFIDTNGLARTLPLEHLWHGAQVPDELQALYQLLRERPLPLGASLALFRRFGDYVDYPNEDGTINLATNPVGGKYFDEYNQSRKAEGLDHHDPTLPLDAFRLYPSVQDIIRFAVREVYTPEIAGRFGAFEDLPEEFLKESRKAGLRPEDARNYWAAHWDLPSTTQGFEMLHRGIITQDDLRLLLRALDVQPFWRDKLIQMSYRVKRIVDIDRMYEQRVIPRLNYDNLRPEEPIIKEFMIRGYNFEDAKNRAVWLDRARPDPGTEATIKATTKSYQKGYIDDVEYESVLTSLMLPKATKEFIVSSARVERDAKRLDNVVKRLKPLLLDGSISQAEFIQKLERFNLTQSSIRDLIEEIEAERGERTKGLTESQILRLYKGDYLKDSREAIDLLIRSGRSPRAAQILIKEADDDKRTGADSIPLADMKEFYSAGHVTAELFRDYLQAKAVPPWAINAYIDMLRPIETPGVGG